MDALVLWLRHRARTTPPLVADGALAVVVLALNSAVLSQGMQTDPGASRAPDLLGYLLVAALSLPLAVRRRYPRMVLATVLVLMGVYLGLGYPVAGVGETLLIAVYTAGSQSTLRATWPVHALLLPVLAVAVATSAAPASPLDIGYHVVLYVGAWWLGSIVRSRRDYARRLEERTKQLEQARLELADQAVAQERLRIARELHDVVTHTMSVIAVQSGAGEHVIDAQPQIARETLREIKVTSREALAEMRHLLGVLRAEDETTGSRSPPGGLANLDALVRQVRQAGVTVTVDVQGNPDAVPATVDLSAYRIVQEALTNVLKHAGTTSATVTVRYVPNAVSLLIRDNGPGVATVGAVGPEPNGGTGIVGMRERVQLLGGQLTAGPLPDGGFGVEARLPYPGRSQ
jgi:signal transduction histidine kinase